MPLSQSDDLNVKPLGHRGQIGKIGHHYKQRRAVLSGVGSGSDLCVMVQSPRAKPDYAGKSGCL